MTESLGQEKQYHIYVLCQSKTIKCQSWNNLGKFKTILFLHITHSDVMLFLIYYITFLCFKTVCRIEQAIWMNQLELIQKNEGCNERYLPSSIAKAHLRWTCYWHFHSGNKMLPQDINLNIKFIKKCDSHTLRTPLSLSKCLHILHCMKAKAH